MLKCNCCGNKLTFRAWQRCRGTMRVTVNSNCEWVADIDNNQMDYDISHGPFECHQCGAEVIETEETEETEEPKLDKQTTLYIPLANKPDSNEFDKVAAIIPIPNNNSDRIKYRMGEELAEFICHNADCEYADGLLNKLQELM